MTTRAVLNLATSSASQIQKQSQSQRPLKHPQTLVSLGWASTWRATAKFLSGTIRCAGTTSQVCLATVAAVKEMIGRERERERELQ